MSEFNKKIPIHEILSNENQICAESLPASNSNKLEFIKLIISQNNVYQRRR